MLDDIITFSEIKESKGSMSALNEKEYDYVRYIKENVSEIIEYFQSAFTQVESQHMPYLLEELSLLSKRLSLQNLLTAQENLTKQKILFFNRNHLLDNHELEKINLSFPKI